MAAIGDEAFLTVDNKAITFGLKLCPRKEEIGTCAGLDSVPES